MGMFGGLGGAISDAAKSTVGAVKDAGKTVSKSTGEVVKAGALGPFEYLTVKPLEWLAPKVLELAGRGRVLAGQASQLQSIAQQTAAENQGLLASLGLGDVGSLFGGMSGAPSSAATDNGTFTSDQAGSGRLWLWLGLGAAVIAFFYLRRKA